MLAITHTDAKHATLAVTDGILHGTIVLTLRGEVAVENLLPGDKVITRDSGVAIVEHAEALKTLLHTVTVKAGSLGHTRPETDVTIPADQHILIRDWRARSIFGRDQAIVPAKALVDQEFVTDNGVQDVIVYQICLQSQHTIYAGGLELQSHTPALSQAA